ncbi:MAG: site-specific DNA-methyltransferase [Planctomycetes bacterium]|nr:site-specific DNA-methyltransferase [Planctomycetota bacterium]
MKEKIPYLNKIVHGNCIDVSENIESNSIHLILSDIPYGIGIDDWDVLHSNTNSAFLGTSPAQEKAGAVFKKRGKPLNGWSEADKQIPVQYYEWCLTWAKDWLRILKPGGSAIVFAGRRLAHRCIGALEDSGFTYKDMIAWSKEKAPHRAQRLSVVFGKRGDSQTAEYWDGWRVGNLRPIFEPILWFVKPYKIGGTISDNMLENEVGAFNEKAFLKYTNSPDNIIRIGSIGTDTGLHPTQKPLRLMQALIELTTKENQLVLDPFCGSGTTIIAAASLNRNYIGIELDESYHKIATDRLSKYIQMNANNLFSLIK